MTSLTRLTCFIVLILLAGCASSSQGLKNDVSPVITDNGTSLDNYYRVLKNDGQRNEVLNQMRLGIAAMRLGNKDVAKQAFDSAIKGIETVFANNETAQTARSLWYEEGMKDFKGEPYERAMAYYYRGLLYLDSGDFENARAAFKSGIINDSFAEEEQYRCDFALLMFLEGLASTMRRDQELAQASFKELANQRPDFKPPADYNVLFVIETGTAPRKISDGPGHSELKYRRGKYFTEQKAKVSIDASPLTAAYPMEDIFFQADTRGGREIDKILKDKVVFREQNLLIGTTLSDTSRKALLIAPLIAIASNNSSALTQVQGVAGAIGVIGAIQQVMAINAKPQADTRYWDNLPDSVHVMLAKLPPGHHTYTISFTDNNNQEVAGISRKGEFTLSSGQKLSLIWIKSR